MGCVNYFDLQAVNLQDNNIKQVPLYAVGEDGFVYAADLPVGTFGEPKMLWKKGKAALADVGPGGEFSATTNALYFVKGGALHVSTDKGDKWTAHSLPGSAYSRVAASEQGKFFVVGSSNATDGIAVSNDGGKNWFQPELGVDDGGKGKVITSLVLNDTVVIASTLDGLLMAGVKDDHWARHWIRLTSTTSKGLLPGAIGRVQIQGSYVYAFHAEGISVGTIDASKLPDIQIVWGKPVTNLAGWEYDPAAASDVVDLYAGGAGGLFLMRPGEKCIPYAGVMFDLSDFVPANTMQIGIGPIAPRLRQTVGLTEVYLNSYGKLYTYVYSSSVYELDVVGNKDPRRIG